MKPHTRFSPGRVALGSLLGLAIVIPVVYLRAVSGNADGSVLVVEAGGRALGITLPDPPAGVERVLPANAIPAIHDPQFLTVEQARAPDDAPMIAVTRGGQTHAYSLRLLNSHEIVNDTVGGDPIAVTW